MQSKATNSPRLSVHHFVLKTRMTNARVTKWHSTAITIPRIAGAPAHRGANNFRGCGLSAQERRRRGRRTTNRVSSRGKQLQPETTAANLGWGIRGGQKDGPGEVPDLGARRFLHSAPRPYRSEAGDDRDAASPTCFAPFRQRPTISSGSAMIWH